MSGVAVSLVFPLYSFSRPVVSEQGHYYTRRNICIMMQYPENIFSRTKTGTDLQHYYPQAELLSLLCNTQVFF